MNSPHITQTDTLLDAVENTATSSHVSCSGAKAIMLTFSSAAVSTVQDRKMTLTVEVNGDNSDTFHEYKMLIDNDDNTDEQTLTRVKQKIIDGTVATHILWFTPETLGAITRFRVILTRDAAENNGVFTVKSSVLY